MATRAARELIVNADDFGWCEGVNEGIIEAHLKGIVTSTSMMVRPQAARAAAALARKHPALDLGLHIDLGEWVMRDGEWYPLYTVVSSDDPLAIADEIRRQVEAFHMLVGSYPTHLDSHQHVHLQEPVRSVVMEVGRNLGVPVRHATPGVRYCGKFYGQTAEGNPLPDALSSARLMEIIEGLSWGVTELACHPGSGDLPETMYRRERTLELKALCDPRVRNVINRHDIRLRTFEGILIEEE